MTTNTINMFSPVVNALSAVRDFFAAHQRIMTKRGIIASEPKPHDFAAASGRAATAAAKHVDRLAPPFDFRN